MASFMFSAPGCIGIIVGVAAAAGAVGAGAFTAACVAAGSGVDDAIGPSLPPHAAAMNAVPATASTTYGIRIFNVLSLLTPIDLPEHDAPPPRERSVTLITQRPHGTRSP
jgi:hypothetical protein